MFEDGNLSTYLSISGKLTQLKDLTMFVKLTFSLEQVSEIKMILFHLESGDVSILFALWFFLYTKLSSTQQTTTYIHGMLKNAVGFNRVQKTKVKGGGD